MEVEMVSSARSTNKELSLGRKPNKGRTRKERYPEQDITDNLLSNEKDEQSGKGKGERDKKDKKPKEKKFSWPIWKKLFAYAMKRKFHLLLGLALNIGFAVVVSLLPLKVGAVLDMITISSIDESENNLDILKWNIMLLGVLTGLLAIFTYSRFLSMQFLQQFMAMDMRNEFYTRFISNDLHFFEQYRSGELVSRLSSDVGQAKSAVSNNLTFLIRHLIIIVGSIAVLFTINLELTLLVLLIVPFYLLVTCFYSRKKKMLVKQRQDVEAQIAAEVAERFSGIQLVKAYSTEKDQIRRYGNIINKAYQVAKKSIFLTGMYLSISQFLPYMAIMLVLWYGGHMVMSGYSQLSAGQLTSFILYCRSLSSSSESIASTYTNIINGTYAVQKVFEMLEYESQVDEASGEHHTISGEITFDHVHFKYPTSETLALRDVSFKISEGEYIAFVGESGSGKSTIIKLIEKFYQLESGRIFYGQWDQSVINATTLRRQIGLVNQEATLFSGTIKDNIIYGLESYTEEQVQDAAERAGCLEFLDNPNRFPQRFNTFVGERGSTLSGGQKQRVSIARALMRKPKIVIFDEATSALDSNSERMVQESIESLAGGRGKTGDRPTILVIAHRLSTVMKADRIFVMKNGEIIESGCHRELLERKGYYFTLIEKQLSNSPEQMSGSAEKVPIPQSGDYEPPIL